MGRIAEEEREKLHVRLDKIEQIFYINSGDFIPKSRKYKCTNGAQTLVVWAFSNFDRNLRTIIFKNQISICNVFEGKSSQKHLGNIYKFEWF